MLRDVELKELVGPHTLSGVEFESAKVDPLEVGNDAVDSSNVMRFVLDGRILVATEDPDDGYRSMLGDLQEVAGPPVANSFSPVAVVGHMDPNHDILVLRLAATGEEVLRVGTEDFDGYYPCFEAWFDPRVLGEVGGT